jgi:hypothetical protein
MGLLWEEIDNRTRLKRAYFFIYYLHRIIFVSVAVFLNHESMVGLQIVLVLYLNFFSLIYIGSVQALDGKEFNQIDLIN